MEVSYYQLAVVGFVGPRDLACLLVLFFLSFVFISLFFVHIWEVNGCSITDYFTHQADLRLPQYS